MAALRGGAVRPREGTGRKKRAERTNSQGTDDNAFFPKRKSTNVHRIHPRVSVAFATEELGGAKDKESFVAANELSDGRRMKGTFSARGIFPACDVPVLD